MKTAYLRYSVTGSNPVTPIIYKQRIFVIFTLFRSFCVISYVCIAH